MFITGPYITRAVVVPEHTEYLLDLDAYWNLDDDGTLLDEGAEPTLMYAKVAYPTLAAAQHQYQLERLALQAQRAPVKRSRKK